jgi:phosphinothricin acetyltransferase
MYVHIRDATEADLPAIVDIYNQSIPAGWSTADTQPITVAERVEWFNKFDPAKRPIWVADIGGVVVATAYLSSFYGGRPAYDTTAEVSVYIASAYHRRGIGRLLKQWVIEQCPRLGVTTLLSMHFDHNEATRRINESLGFQQMGHLTEHAAMAACSATNNSAQAVTLWPCPETGQAIPIARPAWMAGNMSPAQVSGAVSGRPSSEK